MTSDNTGASSNNSGQLQPQPVDLVGIHLLRRFFSNQRRREGDPTMARFIQRFLRDESGLVVTAELIMIITIAVISLTAGWSAVSAMLAEELEDVANSVGSLNQSFSYNGIVAPGHARCSGGGFNDARSFVNVSTSSNFQTSSSNIQTSVAGQTFSQIAPQYGEAQVLIEEDVLVEAPAEEQLVLVEEEFGIDVQISQELLIELCEYGIVEICENGAVVLLREDLIEICEDGSVVILYEAIQREGIQRQPCNFGNRDSLTELEACRKELASLQKQLATQRATSPEQLQQENARLRQQVEKLTKESKSR